MRKQTYLPTADNEVEVRRQLIQAKYGGGGNTEDLLALAINNQLDKTLTTATLCLRDSVIAVVFNEQLLAL